MCTSSLSPSLSVGYSITPLHPSIPSSYIHKAFCPSAFFPHTHIPNPLFPSPSKFFFYNKATAPIPIANKPAAIFGACVSYAAPSEVALLAAPPRREVALPTIPPTPPEVAELSALLALEVALLSALLALLSALLALDEREELFEEKRERG